MCADRVKPPGIHYSSSQVTNYLRCFRLWYYESVLGLRGPDKPPQIVGKYIHSISDSILRGEDVPGDLVHRTVLVRKVKSYLDGLRAQLPNPRVGLSPETEIKRPFTVNGEERWWWGFVDAHHTEHGVWENRQHQLEVIDHKSMGTTFFRKQPPELSADVQMKVYAYWLMNVLEDGGLPAVQRVKLTHGQLKARGKDEHHICSITCDRESIVSTWNRVLPIVEEMDTTRLAEVDHEVSATGLRNNNAGCNAFGGCPHKEMCRVAERAQKVEWKMLRDTTSDVDPLDAMMAKARAITTPGKEEEVDGTEAAFETEPTVEIPPTDQPESADEEDTPSKKKVVRRRSKVVDPEKIAEAEGQKWKTDLYIDAIPETGFREKYVMFDSFIEPILASLREESGIADWRLHEYGKGAGYVRIALRKSRLPKVLVITTESTLATECLAELRNHPQVKKIVRGVK